MNRIGLLIAAAVAVVYLVLVARQLGRPLMYDDANFALAARAVAETGLPFGNQGWMSERGDFSQREQWALWHPPLYIYASGLISRLVGWTPPALRLLGLLGGLATTVLTYLLARELTRGTPTTKDLAGGVAVALTLLSPLAIQSALIVDIDFSFLLPLTLLFLFLYLRLEGRQRGWLWLAPLFTVLLWTKMTNPLPLVGVIAAWQVLRGRPLRGITHAVAIGLGGVALFGITWLSIGGALGFPLDMPFGVNLVQWRDSTTVARRAYVSVGAFINGLQPTVAWLGPGLVGLGLAAIAVRLALLARCWRFVAADLVVGVVVAFGLGYVNKEAGGFPKYQVALAPLLACLAAPLVAHAVCARPRLAVSVGAASLVAGGLVTLRMVRDDWALQRTWQIDATPAALLLGTVVVGTALGVPWRAAAATGLASVVGVALGWSVAVDAVQFRAEYQTGYFYGTTGTLDTVEWVDAHLSPDQTYVGAKEVAIRSRAQRYIDQDNLTHYFGAGIPFDRNWYGEPVRAVVAWQREPYIADLFGRELPRIGFRETARFGDYVIYEPAGS